MLRVGGIILCGGHSSRMGKPKAWLPIGGELMLPRVVRILGEMVSPIVVVAAEGQDLPDLPRDVELVRDEERDRGPLQGLAAGLQAFEERADAAYVSSCDVPFLRPAFVRRMIDLLGSADFCVPKVDGRLHPLAAVYRIAVLEAVRRLLHEKDARLTLLADLLPTRVVGASEFSDVDPTQQSLRNLNTLEEYEQAFGELS